MLISQNIDLTNPQALFQLFQKQEETIRLQAEQIALLKAKLFGKSSEKPIELNPDQTHFLSASEAELEELEVIEEQEVKAHKRKKSGRKSFPENLIRREVIHDLSDAEKICSCGCSLKRIGQETSEQLEFIPAKLEVIVNVRPKYTCLNCEKEKQEIKLAALPLSIIPKSMATPSLLAQLMTAKFVDSLPFYRQEKQFQRLGIELSRNNMINWALKLGVAIKRLCELLHHEILSGDLIHIDETPIQVLKEEGKKASSQSYIWVLRGGAGVYFYYSRNRSSETAQNLLHGFEGSVLSDAYSGYRFLNHQPNIRHAACWVHVRRKFDEVLKAKGKNGKEGNADKALSFIKQLYRIEHEANDKGLGFDQRLELRKEKSIPLLQEFHTFLLEKQNKVVPSALLGKAIQYALNQWQQLLSFTKSGFIPLDNNPAENAIRPFVIGRKNWLFCDSVAGAKTNARMYSLIETAKAYKLNPFEYLKKLFKELPFADSEDKIRALLPQNIRLDQS
jgi:transposase